MSYEEFYRRELELKTFHNPKVSIAQVRNECRERRMTYRLGKKENLDDQVSGNNAGYEKFPIVYLFKKSSQGLFEFLG